MPSFSIRAVLEWSIPLGLRIFLIFLCALLPTAYMVKQYTLRHDLSQLIVFGKKFVPTELPEVRKFHPVLDPQSGYDGQFYAQMAIDPTLQRPEYATAIDDPAFRSQRIVLPTIAFLLGAGQPAAILIIYALLNIVFWYILFVALLRWIRFRTVQDACCIGAITLTSGALVSIQRALTDLPAAVFGTLGLMGGEIGGAVLIAVAILTKPTSGLFLLRYLTLGPATPREWARRGAIIVAAVAPFILWLVYIHHIFARLGPEPLIWPFDLPLRGVLTQGVVFSQSIASTPASFDPYSMKVGEWNLFQFLTLFSLTVQAVWLLVRPRWKDVFWMVGAGFALMFLCLSAGELVEEQNFNRTVLALTICFNITLWRHGRGWAFLVPFLLGNVGLILHLHLLFIAIVADF
jgi:hypothetical protein